MHKVAKIYASTPFCYALPIKSSVKSGKRIDIFSQDFANDLCHIALSYSQYLIMQDLQNPYFQYLCVPNTRNKIPQNLLQRSIKSYFHLK